MNLFDLIQQYYGFFLSKEFKELVEFLRTNGPRLWELIQKLQQPGARDNNALVALEEEYKDVIAPMFAGTTFANKFGDGTLLRLIIENLDKIIPIIELFLKLQAGPIEDVPAPVDENETNGPNPVI